MQTKLLVVNPNSSQSMTEAIKENIENKFLFYLSAQEKPTITYFTAPKNAPLQIEDEKTSIDSLNECYPVLTDTQSDFYYGNFRGILVACFSDHPLVHTLRERNKLDKNNTLILGLLETSINYCSMYGDQPFSIITSNKEWVSILNKYVEENLLTNYVTKNNLWRGTVSTDLQVLDLHDPKNFELIAMKIKRENVNRLGSKLVILGCAGFSGLKEPLTSKFNYEIKFIDPITIGLKLLFFAVES